jgi:hypothetical protein
MKLGPLVTVRLEVPDHLTFTHGTERGVLLTLLIEKRVVRNGARTLGHLAKVCPRLEIVLRDGLRVSCGTPCPGTQTLERDLPVLILFHTSPGGFLVVEDLHQALDFVTGFDDLTGLHSGGRKKAFSANQGHPFLHSVPITFR